MTLKFFRQDSGLVAINHTHGLPSKHIQNVTLLLWLPLLPHKGGPAPCSMKYACQQGLVQPGHLRLPQAVWMTTGLIFTGWLSMLANPKLDLGTPWLASFLLLDTPRQKYSQIRALIPAVSPISTWLPPSNLSHLLLFPSFSSLLSHSISYSEFLNSTPSWFATCLWPLHKSYNHVNNDLCVSFNFRLRQYCLIVYCDEFLWLNFNCLPRGKFNGQDLSLKHSDENLAFSEVYFKICTF